MCFCIFFKKYLAVKQLKLYGGKLAYSKVSSKKMLVQPRLLS
jgi:hypothetical protein